MIIFGVGPRPASGTRPMSNYSMGFAIVFWGMNLFVVVKGNFRKSYSGGHIFCIDLLCDCYGAGPMDLIKI